MVPSKASSPNLNLEWASIFWNVPQLAFNNSPVLATRRLWCEERSQCTSLCQFIDSVFVAQKAPAAQYPSQHETTRNVWYRLSYKYRCYHRRFGRFKFSLTVWEYDDLWSPKAFWNAKTCKFEDGQSSVWKIVHRFPGLPQSFSQGQIPHPAFPSMIEASLNQMCPGN